MAAPAPSIQPAPSAPPAPPRLRREWRIKYPDGALVTQLVRALGVSDVVAGLLVNRGILDPDAARSWLNPRLRDLLDPAGLRGMDVAVTTILATLDRGERVTIYGDYDVDGMTASSILARFLRWCGYDPHVFLPDRFRDGYGVNKDRVRDLIEAGTRLVVTVDCGITAVEQVTLAKELGAEFVIVDHHQLPEGPLPPAVAIINPHHPDCSFPFKGLCAAGLAFHLALALRAELRRRGFFADRPEPDIRLLLDIAAVGTVADMVPLRGINRILVTTGIERMRESRHPGIRALIAVGARGRTLTSETIGFQIGPRLNAAGRLSHPYKGFEILATDDPARAQEIAEDIDAENQRRREVQDVIETEAMEQALREQGADADAFVLWSDDWHPGVAGIVAARVVNRFHRPCAVIAVKDGVGKGSIRSIKGCDVVMALRRCAESLEQFGGHPHAAGVTVKAENLPAFREGFARAARELTPPECFTPTLSIDADIGFGRIGGQLISEINALAPFGSGNAQPRFCTRGVRVLSTRLVGKTGDHLKLYLEHEGCRFDAIAFGFGPHAPVQGQVIDIAFRPEFNEYMGNVSVQLRVQDIQE